MQRTNRLEALVLAPLTRASVFIWFKFGQGHGRVMQGPFSCFVFYALHEINLLEKIFGPAKYPVKIEVYSSSTIFKDQRALFFQFRIGSLKSLYWKKSRQMNMERGESTGEPPVKKCRGFPVAHNQLFDGRHFIRGQSDPDRGGVEREMGRRWMVGMRRKRSGR
ncbi:hypothetical protein HELRODRAFT_166017 [Helobdella robusta]|uniref:Uncharacterized protein n=1 Tax=Helobdella robusta TaxID=6412 RepID=T1EXL6_HELRO|nr:hypothetical protein HELRODRAFT_166017 [Helobdella robusta]ESN90359.1 hypothetical protein HELRODRAFT_166017 [Helobdella robusta]